MIEKVAKISSAMETIWVPFLARMMKWARDRAGQPGDALMLHF